MEYFVYSATGNNFVITEQLHSDIQKLCLQEKVDGLITVSFDRPEYDFQMIYYNRDGNRVSMCGNGLRAAGVFVQKVLGKKPENEAMGFKVITDAGTYFADPKEVPKTLLVRQDVLDFPNLISPLEFKFHSQGFFNTGVPHLVFEIDDVQALDLIHHGAPLSRDEGIAGGTNINFFKDHGDFLEMRTYERGVYAETLSCGTGIAAVGLHCWEILNKQKTKFSIKTRGGDLELSKDPKAQGLWLSGPVTLL